MHETHYYRVVADVICDNTARNCMLNPAMIVDRVCGSVIQVDDFDTSSIQADFITKITTLKSVGDSLSLRMADDYQLVLCYDFDGLQSVGDICTAINYLRSGIGKDAMDKFFNMSAVERFALVKKYQDLGF